MPANSIRGVMGDTSFWIEAFDKRGDHHDRAANLLENLRARLLLIPWPITYEVLRTRTVRNRVMVGAFQRTLSGKVLLIDDAKYRKACLETTFDLAVSGRRPISLVDSVVRAVLSDGAFRVSQLLTFNPGDFADVCRARQVQIWPND